MTIGESIRGLFHKKSQEERSTVEHMNRQQKETVHSDAKKIGEGIREIVHKTKKY